MNKYKYKICLCDGKFCGGSLTVEAENEDDAYQEVCGIVGLRLYNAFPELDIEYYCELEEVIPA